MERFDKFLSELEGSDRLPVSAIARYHWGETENGPILRFNEATIFFLNSIFMCFSGSAFSKIQGICRQMNPQFKVAPDPISINMRAYASNTEQSLTSPNLLIS